MDGLNQIKDLNNWFTSPRQKQATARRRNIRWRYERKTNWYRVFHLARRLHTWTLVAFLTLIRVQEGRTIQLKTSQWQTAEAYLALISWLTQWEVHRWLTYTRLGVQSKQSAADVANLTPAVCSRGWCRTSSCDCMTWRNTPAGGRAASSCILHFNEPLWFLSLFQLIEFLVALCWFRECHLYLPPSANGKNVGLIKMQHFLQTICI